MQVRLQAIGKKFRHRWIFKNLNHVFHPAGKYVITGKNGSGKSTLVRILSASQRPSEGIITWERGGLNVDPGRVFSHISIAAHYIDITGELTFRELIGFHKKLKKFPEGITAVEIARISGLYEHADKYISHFSSGMKQRAILTLSMLSGCNLLLLDEPCTSLDQGSRQWYRDMLSKYCGEKTVIIASNSNREEYTRDFTLLDLEGM